MAAERWAPVVGQEGAYEVSDLGRVRSLSRERSGKTQGWLQGVVLKPTTTEHGYQVVRMAGRTRRVHQLVLETFVAPRPFPNAEGRHGDGDPSNNRPVNLSWGTHAENMQDLLRHGRHNHASKERCARRGHLLQWPNLQSAQWKLGRRHCRSCQWARAVARRADAAGRPIDRDEFSDAIHAYLMEGGPHPRSVQETFRLAGGSSRLPYRQYTTGRPTTMSAICAGFAPGDEITPSSALAAATEAGAVTSRNTVITTLHRGVQRGQFEKLARGRYRRLPDPAP